MHSTRRRRQQSYLTMQRQKQPPRLFSKISVLFIQEHLFLEFSSRLNVFNEQIPIFQQGMSISVLRRTDTDFPGALFLATEQIPIFQKHSYSYRTDANFPEEMFLATEQIQIFQEPFFFATEQITNLKKVFFKYQRTDRKFPGAPL